MTDKYLIEKMARQIMLNRTMMDNPGCDVVDWRREELENPHVAQAMAQARACMSVVADFIFSLEKK